MVVSQSPDHQHEDDAHDYGCAYRRDYMFHLLIVSAQESSGQRKSRGPERGAERGVE
jgi:hypothetical protein